jgi:MauM/NapG family ferredoxin protein
MSDTEAGVRRKAEIRPAWPGRAPAAAWARWRRLRQVIQLLAFAFFIYLLFAAQAGRAALPLADLFFRLDPLAALGAMLAARAWIPRLGLALVTVGLTLAVGRVWCGWLCPLGTLLEWTTFPGARQRAAALPWRWRSVKYLVLLITVAAALFGSLALLAFDPLALLTRAAATAVLPALDHAVTAIETALYRVPAMAPLADGLEGLLRGAILPVRQTVFAQNALLAALLAGLIALNALADRFWCRYLCPLGALLGLAARVSLLRPVIGQACDRCARCVGACPLGAIDGRGFEIVPAECTVCLDCLATCSQPGNGFQLRFRPGPAQQYDPTRRQFVGALLGGAAGVALLQTGTRTQAAHPEMVRPPGAQDEEAFLARCLRCGQCLRVCPTAGLQPALLEAGLEGLWTPRLVPRLGYCDYGCNACGQVCPAGAIPPLDLEAKRAAVIGLAAVDRDRCLPWAYDVPCIVCEEMCPVPDKAIVLEEVTVTGEDGSPIVLQRPYVRQELCIGCGICEYQCPMGGQAAIRVHHP